MSIILYIATSLDGFIADKHGGVDWLPQPSDPADLEKVGYQKLLDDIAIIVIGDASYRQILSFGEWAWPDKITYVFTHTTYTTTPPDVRYISGDVTTCMKKINTAHPDKKTWLLGGADLIQQFAQAGLIDECIITIAPVTLGEGIKLAIQYESFTLLETKKCLGDLTQKHYIKK